MNPFSTALRESTDNLMSWTRTLVCLLLSPKSAWIPKSCLPEKIGLLSVVGDLMIALLFGPKVDKGVPFSSVITREQFSEVLLGC